MKLAENDQLFVPCCTVIVKRSSTKTSKAVCINRIPLLIQSGDDEQVLIDLWYIRMHLLIKNRLIHLSRHTYIFVIGEVTGNILL